MTTLVTGGGGFVGSHLVAALLARGEKVRIIDLSDQVSHEAALVKGSVTDADATARACEGVDTVFHLAGNAQLWARDARVFDDINHQGTRTMLAAARAAGVRRFIHCSSLTTLVGRSTPIGASHADESVDLPPEAMLGAYPRTKALADRAVLAAASDGLDALIAIPTEPLGPGDRGLTPPTQMILDLINGKTPATIDCLLNFVPVASLAEGLIAARDKGARGERYLLGGENLSMRALLAMIEKLSGKAMPKTQLPYAVALAAGVIDTGLVARLTGEPPKAPLTGVRLAGRRVSLSSEKAARDLGWRASPVEPALEATLQWFQDEGLTAAA